MIWKRLKKKTREEEEDYEKKLNETGIEKNDFLAMVLSAWMIILPVAIIVLGVVGLFFFLFFR